MIQKVRTVLEKIRYKLFPIRYSTVREFDFLMMMIPITPMVIVIILLGGIHIDIADMLAFTEPYEVAAFIFINAFLVHSGSYKPTQWLFKKVGKKYNGRIVGADVMWARDYGNVFYLLIEFKRGKKTLIRKTTAYIGAPDMYLKNDKCCVYEFMGRFIEADFNIKKRYSEEADEDCFNFRVTKHKPFELKGKKYV